MCSWYICFPTDVEGGCVVGTFDSMVSATVDRDVGGCVVGKGVSMVLATGTSTVGGCCVAVTSI